MDIANLHYFNKSDSAKIINSIKSERQRLINLLMLDCGLRVSEAVSLRYDNFDFKNKTLIVKSLKKRSEKPVYRSIPLSDRLYSQLADYVYKRKNVQPETFLFPGSNDDRHVTRFAVNRYLNRLATREHIHHLHPHALRHSFATQHLSEGTPLENIKTMLGHSSYNTTLIYAHIPEQILRQNIDNVTTAKPPLFTRMVRMLNPKPQKAINISFHSGNVSIGRNDEMETIVQNLARGINTLVLGTIGVGKSHLLRQVQAAVANAGENQNHSSNSLQTLQPLYPKVLKFDDIGNIKTSLANMLLYLYNNDKETIFNLIYKDFDKSKAIERITRESTKNLCNQIKKITQKHEYIIMVDTLDDITNKAVRVLEELKDHFIIIGAAREVKVDKSSFLWNFDIVRLKPLPRTQAIELIYRLSSNLQVDDFDLFKNHIYEQTNGNPRAIYEICDRYHKEPVLSTARIRAIRHTGAIPEVDCTLIILIFLAVVACLRYLNHEVENNSMRLIGGAAMVLLIISRYFMKSTKKKFI
jgi:hypothetical protein